MSKIKISFGLTEEKIKYIEDKIEYWNKFNTSDNQKDWYMYNKDLWEEAGKHLDWLPLSLCLTYFKYKFQKNE